MNKYGKGKNSKNHFFCDKLNHGFAMEVTKEKIKDFFETISSCDWIQIIGENIEFKNQKYYFILTGRSGQKFDLEIFE